MHVLLLLVNTRTYTYMNTKTTQKQTRSAVSILDNNYSIYIQTRLNKYL